SGLDDRHRVTIRGATDGWSGEARFEVEVVAVVHRTEGDGPGSLSYLVTHAPNVEHRPTIRFSPEVFGPGRAQEVVIASTLVAAADLRIEAPLHEGAPFLRISGAGARRILRVEAGRSVELFGLILAEGDAGDEDGGCIDSGGELLLEQVHVLGCEG